MVPGIVRAALFLLDHGLQFREGDVNSILPAEAVALVTIIRSSYSFQLLSEATGQVVAQVVATIGCHEVEPSSEHCLRMLGGKTRFFVLGEKQSLVREQW